MEYSKILMQAKSPFSGLFTADQMWGQFVWAIAHSEGADRAEEFVTEFLEKPPFLVSAMMPEGYFPIPMLPPKRTTDVKFDPEARKRTKRNKKLHWLSFSDFAKVQRDYRYLSTADLDISGSPEITEISETKVSIDRLTNSQVDGSLHTLSYLYARNPFVVYLAFPDGEKGQKERIEKILSFLSLDGLGGDRSVGRGVFSLDFCPVSKEEQALFSFDRGNAFMTLSRCFGKDLHPLYYSVTAYAGIVGGHPEGNMQTGMFNKKPIIGYEPGSVFASGSGCVVRDIHPDKRIASYGFAFPVPLSLEVN